MGKDYLIRGRLMTEDSGRPITDVVVKLYWVEPTKISDENAKKWYDMLADKTAVSLADEVTVVNPDGVFEAPLAYSSHFDEEPYIGIIISALGDGSQVSPVQPLFRMEVAKPVSEVEDLTLRIPGSKANKAQVEASAKSTSATIDRLNRQQERAQAVKEWHKEHRRKTSETIDKEFGEKARQAFKDFTPSTVPAALRESDNYFKREAAGKNDKENALEDRKCLHEKIQKIQNKAIQDVPIRRTRELDVNKLRTESQKNNDAQPTKAQKRKEQQVNLASSSLLELLTGPRYSPLEKALMARKERSQHEHALICELFGQLNKTNDPCPNPDEI